MALELRFVTTNRGKFDEVAAALRPHGITLQRVDAPYPEVQADTLEEVVTFGLNWLRGRHGGDLLIDDSGLFVEALGGFPGVYSAYVHRTLGLQGILRLMEGREDRRAHFQACFGLLRGDEVGVVRGKCEGTITNGVRGKGGFGYDPIFAPGGHRRTFGEMSIEEKNLLSHRGRATRELLGYLGVK